MNIKMIGIDHTRAPLDVRQVFAFTRKAMGEALVWLKGKKEISGCIILSTCNRMELWLSCEEGASLAAYEVLCGLKQVEPKGYREYFVYRENEEAVEHLFHMASGLKSQIVGEDQILTQVKEAAAFAREQGCTDPILEVLFRMAVTAAKKVKTQVPIQKANYSAAHQALESLKKQGYEVSGKKCLVIGNGEMGRLTALALQEEGAHVTMTVRQYRTGVILIPEGVSRINYGERYDHIPACDLVVSATASPNFTITREGLEQSVGDGRAKVPEGADRGDQAFAGERIFIDLAVPRDIESSVNQLAGIRLFDIDSFQIDAKSETMKRQIRQAEVLIQEQEGEFFDWYESRQLVPRVQKISAQAARDTVWRTGKTVKALRLREAEQERLTSSMEQAAAKVVGKLMFELRDSLRAEAFRDCLDALERVYQENE